MTMICKYCGNELTDKPISPEIFEMITAVYCRNCGKDVKEQYRQDKKAAK
jgi:hypothetical protein